MNFCHVLHAAIGLLVIEGRLSYQRLRAEFDLDDSQLQALRFELTEVKGLAVDQDGEILAWAGAGDAILARAHRPTLAFRSVEPAPTEVATPQLLEAPAAVEPVASEAERRPLTVMFCDLADSTALSTKLDPEDLQDVIRAYRERCTDVIREYEGFVAKYMGDGILVYFGYPKSLERNAERAIRTGLAIVAAMAALNHALGREKGIDLAVRIGIATGLVVVGEIVGEGLAQERTVIGEAPNVAARLQGIAPRNGIVIGALTKEIAGDVFVYQELGARELKGISGLVKAWSVSGLSEMAEEGETEAGGTQALVGRDEEIGLLRRAWQSTKDQGRGQVVSIAGEPGIGKTALVETLRADARAEHLPRIVFRCSPYHTNSALYPVIEHVRRLLRWQPEDTAERRLEKLEAMLGGYSQPLAEVVPLFASLLSLPLPEARYTPLDLSPQQLKQQIQDALIAWTLEEAERQPTLEVWEDLHWADPSTLELLGLLLDQAPTAPILLVFTFRPDFVPPWANRSHVTPITLNRLERLQTESLVALLAGGKSLPDEVIDHIVGKTDGVPLYVEELTKAILGSDILAEENNRFTLTGPLSTVSIPATLQESLMARLDRLPRVRELAQLGAVLGREFAYEMLQALVDVEEPSLRDGLDQLVDAELLYQRGRAPRAKYIFKHALIQDAAYGSLLKRTRQHYHQQVASLLETRFPETVEAHPELVAHHYTEAGDAEHASAYWRRAGERARAQSANLEAIAYFEKAVKILRELPDDEQRAQKELGLQISLGHANIVATGHGAAGAESAYTRALALCEQLGDVAELAPSLFGLWRFFVAARSLDEANDLALRLRQLAEGKQAIELEVIARYALGYTNLCRGELADARTNLSEGIARYLPEQRGAQIYRAAQDPGVACRAYLGMVEWLLGYPEHAQACIRESVKLAEELSDTFSLAYALCFPGAIVAEMSGGGTDAGLEQGVRIATEKGFALWVAFAKVQQTNLRFRDQQSPMALDELRDSVVAIPKIGVHINTPYFMTLLASAYWRAGRAEEALKVLDEARASGDSRGEHWWLAEIHRLRGEILLLSADADPDEAEACLQTALAVARHQEARSLELRAAMSLARLWRRQGKTDEARALLAPIYDWFTEGFDTPDLKDAKDLLDELARPSPEIKIAG